MNNQPAEIKNKILELAEKRQKIMSLPAKEALDMILSSPDAAPIVHSFAEQDFYFLVNEIGTADAVELLSLASNKQWEYMMDVSLWIKDEIHIDTAVKWFDILTRADSERFSRWMTTEKAAFLELFLYYNLEVGLREHDQDPSVFDENYFTFDDLYYLRFIPKTKTGMDEDKKAASFRQKTLYRFLKQLAEQDHTAFVDLLFYTANVLPAEAEEEAYRLKNMRLAEKGLLPFEDSIGVYRVIKSVESLPSKPVSDNFSNVTAPVPFSPSLMVGRSSVFSQALEKVESPRMLHDLQAEFAALCNRIAVSDQMIIQSKNDLAKVVGKACGYIHIGLTNIENDDRQPEAVAAASAMTKYFLTDIFRLGYTAVANLKSKADKWHQASWTKANKIPLGFWGDRRQGVLGGILVKRPLYFDQYNEGGLYREFESPDEVAAATAIINEIMLLDDLLKNGDFDTSAVSDDTVNFENMVLTLWARQWLNLPEVVDFIGIDDFNRFFTDLMEKNTDKSGTRKTRTKMKTAFLNWLAEYTGREAEELSAAAGDIFEKMFTEIEEEYGGVNHKDLDPRYINMFLVA